MVSSLKNALEAEYLCLSEIYISVNNLLAVLLLPVYLLIPSFLYYTMLLPVYFLISSFILDIVVACLLLYPLFYTDVVAIFLFIHFGTFVYHFKNTITLKGTS